MKKFFVLLLAFCMLLTSAACAPSDPAASDNNNTNNNLLTIEINLPASMFADEDMTTFDAEAYANEQGFTKASLNSDGSVTVTMTKSKYTELLNEMTDSLEATFAELIEAESTPYIKEITHNEDFSTVTVKVEREGYESALFEMTPLLIGMSVMVYQAFLDMEAICVINIVDIANGETINSVTYPITE